MIRVSIFVLVFGFASAMAADRSIADKIAERTAKAEREDVAKRGEIYAEIAHSYVELANERFAAGESDPAKDAIAKAVEFAGKATASARMKGKNIKKTEIKLRECTVRLEDLARRVSVLDRDPIKSAAKQIDELRSQLLDEMFKKR